MNTAEFLLARIAEDEAVAVAAEPHEEWISVGKIEDSGMGTADGEHVARWSPARVMAECEAKRRVIPRHVRCGDGCGPCDEHLAEEPYFQVCDLTFLAQPYADHPDFDPAWRLTRD